MRRLGLQRWTPQPLSSIAFLHVLRLDFFVSWSSSENPAIHAYIYIPQFGPSHAWVYSRAVESLMDSIVKNLIQVGAPKVGETKWYMKLDRVFLHTWMPAQSVHVYPWQILIAIILLLMWSSNVEIKAQFHFFDIFAGKANCTRAWTGSQLYLFLLNLFPLFKSNAGLENLILPSIGVNYCICYLDLMSIYNMVGFCWDIC